MRALAALCLGVLTMSLTAFPALAQDDVMALEIAKDAQRPAVGFPHAHHAETVDCAVCHHDYDAYGNNAGSEGKACADCHASPSPDALSRSFHGLCVGCHEKEAIRAEFDPPVMCGSCHVKKR